MRTKTLDQLLAALPVAARARSASVDFSQIAITGITKDSRTVMPGALFVAYCGVEYDLHRFIPDALARGAAAVVCEEDSWCGEEHVDVPCFVTENGRQAFAHLCAAWYDHPTRDLVIVGVTGTDGKTTTSTLIFHILRAAGLRAGMITTVNAVIGDHTLDTGLHTTTPDADELQGYLAQMRDAGLSHCVLETTSHGLAQHRVDGIEFDVAVITNITHEHLDLHGTREAYRAAKGRLFEMVGAARRSAVHPPHKAAVTPTSVLNADDPFSFEYLRGMPAARHVIYSAHADAASAGGDVQAIRVAHLPSGLALTVRTPRGALELNSALIGEFNVSNILAAVGAALALDIPDEAIRVGVAGMTGVPGRMERINLGQPFTAIVDFAHTPNALEQTLRALRPLTAGRLIVVFGCAGERDTLKRPMMGRAAAQYADVIVLTAEDPRRESLEAIIDQIVAGIDHPAAEVLRVPDRAQAIRTACALAEPGDIVVSCGKGHEQSMCFGTTETPWDEREAMRAAIRHWFAVRSGSNQPAQ
ncbi:MAG: UDP-N-acetylmuramoyl-L-alanyl-D-glutamate--2,6-diaminopimelate ligase [Anaerolineae bacterium]|nr:UDP-N-acetylmuramoyl-L-alanyl-D-glutamate--2,6-diaminopimelate ligase [Thermoflexales bacterium]MDW8407542.1 UDP-N-acetylmuramoyl-L-alanyl-D-glutamate--2,6-diaminopimelate ligase [Anaerolineae bacterium]